MFTAIFVGLFLAGWLFAGLLPWLATSVVTRGRAGLGMLVLCLITAVVVGLAVPLLGLDNATGLWLSFAGAMAGSGGLLAARRLALGAQATHDREVRTAQPGE